MRSSQFQWEPRSSHDHGFTLIELIIAMTLSLLIGGVVVAALITSLRVSSSTTDEVGDSTDAGLITAFLTRDAQSAGTIVPTTAARNTTVGVSTGSTAWDSCSQAPATLVVRFSWIEYSSAQLQENKVVVTYGLTSPDSLNPTKKQLTRRLCRNGATTGSDVVLARELATVTATCSPVCTSTTTTPTTMWLDVTSWGTTPVAYQLKASVRSDAQATPTVSNSAPVPLLALGAGSSVVCPNVNLSGTGVVTVRGDALVDSLCGAAPIMGNSALLQPTGSTRTIAGIVNPFVARAKPSTSCATTGTNPTVGVSASATTVVKYPQPVNITANTVFQAGRFMFCQGLTFTSGVITGANVLLYIHAGSFEAKPEATVNLTGQTTTDKKMLVWSNQVNTPIKLAGGPKVSHYRGLMYAPASRMELSSVVGLNVEGINTQGLTVTGAGQARIGGLIPTISFPSPAPAGGQVNVAYSTTVTAAGGTAPYTWSATGLPSGLTMSAAGVVTGTPTAPGTYPIIVTAFDSTKASASVDYSLTINAALGIGTASLPNGQVGLAYPTTVLAPTGGTAPYTWSAVSGLPEGLTLSPGGTIAGTPTLAGTYNVTVMVTDAFSSQQKTFNNVIIVGVVSVDGPALPNGQVGVTYATTTVTATGGNPPYTWSWAGAPAGLALDAATGTVSGTPTAAGTFNVVMTATDAVGTSAQATYPVTISLPACPTTSGPWKGQYYSKTDLSGTLKLRDDADINFNWGTTAPISGIASDNYSVRWTRTTNFAAGSYTFALNTDDGSRMYIDGVLVAPLNSWSAAQSASYTQFLTGWHTIVVEYNEKTGSAKAIFTTTFAAVPQVASNGVTAMPSVNDNQPYFGELNLTLNNPTDIITAMSMTFTVAQTPGVSYHGQYTTIPNSDMIYGHETCGLVAYSFTLEQGLTIRTPGSWILAAQWSGTGTPRVTTGDTWSVTTTTSKGTTTLSGTF